MNHVLVARSENIADEQHSIPRSILLHLAPGALITIFYLFIAQNVVTRGLPPLFAMLMAILFVAIPVEFGELMRKGRAHNGRISLRGIIGYCRPMPVWQYFILTMIFLVFALFVSGIAGLLDFTFGQYLWNWFPPQFVLTSQVAAYAGYSRTALAWTFALTAVLNWFAAPIVEEMYFRGYLLPRLSRLGVYAPILNGLLFTLYHFWQPYAYISIFAVMAPLAWIVRRKQNLYLGIIIHSALNIVGNLFLFVGILGQ